MEDLKTREDIIVLVNTFYTKVQENKTLDNLFNTVAKVDWESHLPKMYDFWETLLFHKASYKGNPMQVHKMLHQLEKFKKSDFEIWLELFQETVNELFEGEKAELAKTRALSVATSIQLKTIYSN